MSTGGEQAVAATGETEETKKETTESTEQVAESESPAPAADTTTPSESPEQDAEAEKPQENAVTEGESAEKEESPAAENTEEGGDTATSPPPQIVVDTVPDRDPESPTESDAPKESDKPTETKEEEAPKPAAEPEAEPAKAEETAKPEETKEEPKAEAKEEPKEEAKEATEEKKDEGEAAPEAAAAAAATTEGESANKEEDGKAEAAEAAAPPNPRDFNGKYRQVESENTEAFFQAVGVPWMLRKIATKFSPTTEIRQEDDKFHIKMVTAIITKEWKFTVGEEFEDGGLGWKKESTKVQPSWDGDKVVLLAEPKNEKSKSKPLKTTREMDGNKLRMTFETGDVVCKRVFEKKK